MSSPPSRAAMLVFLAVHFLMPLLLPPGLNSQTHELDDTPHLLTLNEAVQTALLGNRSVRIAAMEVEKSREQVMITKTKRLPSWNAYVFGSQLLSEVGFTFPEGAFGTFKDIGPVPPANTTVTTPRRPTAYVVNQVAQPLSQLYKIHLALRAQQLAVELTSEKLRAERQSVVDSVKQAYYAVLQSENAIETCEAAIKQYQELDRVLLQRVSQETALKSASLEVKAKLAQETYKLVQLRDALESRKEYLNDLLGRDIRTQFRTEEVPALSPIETNLIAAQQTALSHRPEIKQLELTVGQADYERRLAKADYIPDLSLAFHYFSNINFDVLPQNVVALGFEFSWQPFEWGRRKHEVKQKQIALDQTRERLQDTKSKVLLDVNNRFRKLHETRALLAATEAAQDWSREQLRVAINQFAQKAVLLSDVLQQQATVAKSNQEHAEAVLSFWTAKADFEKSLGVD